MIAEKHQESLTVPERFIRWFPFDVMETPLIKLQEYRFVTNVQHKRGNINQIRYDKKRINIRKCKQSKVNYE